MSVNSSLDFNLINILLVDIPTFELDVTLTLFYSYNECLSRDKKMSSVLFSVCYLPDGLSFISAIFLRKII